MNSLVSPPFKQYRDIPLREEGLGGLADWCDLTSSIGVYKILGPMHGAEVKSHFICPVSG